MSFGMFLKRTNASSYSEYAMEKFRETGNINDTPTVPLPALSSKPKKQEFQLADYCKPIQANSDALDYLKRRQIPAKFYNDLWYTPSYGKLADALEPGHGKINLPEDPRIIIPLRATDGRLIGVQGRALVPTKMRYLTCKCDKDHPKIFGLDRFDRKARGYITEGPFDSMFLPNALAAAGSNLSDLARFIDPTNTVFIYDNEPRNSNIILAMNRALDIGNVFFWPENVAQKDINDWVLAHNTTDLVSMIEANTYSGMRAKMRMATWRKS
jgi:hypothetical protein